MRAASRSNRSDSSSDAVADDALLQQRERTLGLDRVRRGRGDHKLLERGPVGRSALTQRLLHPSHDRLVLLDPPHGVGLLLAGKLSDVSETFGTLAVQIGNMTRRAKER